MIGLTGTDEKHDAELMRVADSRLLLTGKIEKANASISAAENEAEAASLREIRSILISHLNEIPDLGATYAEWDQLSDEDKARNLGRPKLSIEARLLRAREAEAEALKTLSDIKGEEVRRHDIPSDIIGEVSKETFVGRPQSDAIDLSDTKRRRLLLAIEHIDSGEAAKEIQERLDRAVKSDRGTPRGRNSEDLGAKRNRLMSEIEDIDKMVSLQTPKMSNERLQERSLKLVRDAARLAKREGLKGTAIKKINGISSALKDVRNDSKENGVDISKTLELFAAVPDELQVMPAYEITMSVLQERALNASTKSSATKTKTAETSTAEPIEAKSDIKTDDSIAQEAMKRKLMELDMETKIDSSQIDSIREANEMKTQMEKAELDKLMESLLNDMTDKVAI
jgi:hypothetical protein